MNKLQAIDEAIRLIELSVPDYLKGREQTIQNEFVGASGCVYVNPLDSAINTLSKLKRAEQETVYKYIDALEKLVELQNDNDERY